MTNQEKLDAARKFSRRVIQASWDSTDVGADSIQEWALELGLIYSRKATDQDEQDYPEIVVGDSMYEFENWMQAIAHEG